MGDRGAPPSIQPHVALACQDVVLKGYVGAAPTRAHAPDGGLRGPRAPCCAGAALNTSERKHLLKVQVLSKTIEDLREALHQRGLELSST